MRAVEVADATGVATTTLAVIRIRIFLQDGLIINWVEVGYTG